MPTITVQHAKSNTIADFTGTVTVFNSAGTTTTAQGTDLVRPSDWNSAHNITFNYDMLNFYEPFQIWASASSSYANQVGQWRLDPFQLDGKIMGPGMVNVFMNMPNNFLNGAVYSSAGGSVTISATFEHDLAIYKPGTGADTTRIEKIWGGDADIFATQKKLVAGASGTTTNSGSVTISNYLTVSMPSQWDGNGGVTYTSVTVSGTTSTAAFTAASTFANALLNNALSYVSGARMDIFGLTASLDAGNYWLAHMVSTLSATATAGAGNYTAGTYFQAGSIAAMPELGLQAYRVLGKSVSALTTNPIVFQGAVQTVSSEAITSLAESDIRYVSNRMYWNFNKEAVT